MVSVHGFTQQQLMDGGYITETRLQTTVTSEFTANSKFINETFSVDIGGPTYHLHIGTWSDVPALNGDLNNFNMTSIHITGASAVETDPTHASYNASIVTRIFKLNRGGSTHVADFGVEMQSAYLR